MKAYERSVVTLWSQGCPVMILWCQRCYRMISYRVKVQPVPVHLRTVGAWVQMCWTDPHSRGGVQGFNLGMMQAIAEGGGWRRETDRIGVCTHSIISAVVLRPGECFWKGYTGPHV